MLYLNRALYLEPQRLFKVVLRRGSLVLVSYFLFIIEGYKLFGISSGGKFDGLSKALIKFESFTS